MTRPVHRAQGGGRGALALAAFLILFLLSVVGDDQMRGAGHLPVALHAVVFRIDRPHVAPVEFAHQRRVGHDQEAPGATPRTGLVVAPAQLLLALDASTQCDG